MHSAWYLAARRELRERVRSRAFQVSTGVQVLLLVGVVVLNAAVGGDDTKKFDVGVVDPRSAVIAVTAQRAEAVVDAKVTIKHYGTLAMARQGLHDEKVDAVVASTRIVTRKNPDGTLVGLLQAAAGAARGAPPPLPVDMVAGKSDDSGKGLAFAATLLLYIGIITFGYVVAGGVVEEKQSRVVEVILSAIRPLQLLTGKVVGIGILGVAQLILIAGVGLGAAAAAGNSIDLPSSTAGTAAIVIVYFALGYAFYSCAYAAAGSLVSRAEDIQSVTAPLLGIVIASYFAALAALSAPNGGLATVCTFLPPSAPMVVPARSAQGELPGWQLAVSITLCVLGTGLVMHLGARIYERSILRIGAPVKLREALRSRQNA